MKWKSFHRYCEIYFLNCSWHQHKQIEPPLTFSTYFCASNRSLNLFLDRSICSLTQFFSFLLALYNNVWCLNVVNFTMLDYFLSFLCPARCALLIFESGMSTSASFTNLLTFSRSFSDVSSFSHGMLVIRRQVLRLYCSLHSSKCSRFLHFSWSATLLSQCIHVLLKQTDSQRELLYLFQFFLNNLLYFNFENFPWVRFYLLNKG